MDYLKSLFPRLLAWMRGDATVKEQIRLLRAQNSRLREIIENDSAQLRNVLQRLETVEMELAGMDQRVRHELRAIELQRHAHSRVTGKEPFSKDILGNLDREKLFPKN